jgi:hypothetical protein
MPLETADFKRFWKWVIFNERHAQLSSSVKAEFQNAEPNLSRFSDSAMSGIPDAEIRHLKIR